MEEIGVHQPQITTAIEPTVVENNGSKSVRMDDSMVMEGIDVYQEDIDTLKPGELINDTILTVMLRYTV